MSTNKMHSTGTTVTSPELSGSRTQSLGDDLVQLNDEINLVADITEFLSNALCLSLTKQEIITPEFISGAQECSFWLTQQNTEVKALAQQVLNRYL